MIAASRLVQMTQNSHSGFLAPRATKPTKEIRRSSAKALQQEEKHGDVGFRLTGEGKRNGAGSPHSELRSTPNQTQENRCSKTYKSLNIRALDRAANEEEKGRRRGEAVAAPHRGSGRSQGTRKRRRGMGRPFKDPHPPEKHTTSMGGRCGASHARKRVNNGGRLWRKAFLEFYC